MSATLISIESQDPVRAMATAKVMRLGLDAYHAALNTPAGQGLDLTNLDLFTLIKNTAPNELKSDVDKEIENALNQVRGESGNRLSGWVTPPYVASMSGYALNRF